MGCGFQASFNNRVGNILVTIFELLAASLSAYQAGLTLKALHKQIRNYSIRPFLEYAFHDLELKLFYYYR